MEGSPSYLTCGSSVSAFTVLLCHMFRQLSYSKIRLRGLSIGEIVFTCHLSGCIFVLCRFQALLKNWI